MVREHALDELADLGLDRIDLETLPATRADAERAWSWAKSECMEHFGPYEDAMSVRSRNLFHTRVSALVNLHRLTPKEVLDDVVAMRELPLSSKEGFIRQLIGWREFMYHVHEQTDGLRTLPGARADPPVDPHPGDGGWASATGERWEIADHPDALDHAAPSELGAADPVPAAFWGEKSGMFCLDHTIEGVWETGYSHHIERLMILSNLATLMDISPRALTDWFWVAYVDAYEWVVEPNVLGMGTFGVGDLFTTKPYVSGSNYIHKMSDYCDSCVFHPKKTCPITPMFWAFLARHDKELRPNHRMSMMFRNLDRRAEDKRARDLDVFERVRTTLAEGRALSPEDFKEK
ncbi:MAG: hypothetical protein AAGI01_11515 [Myxococcota bacterium]